MFGLVIDIKRLHFDGECEMIKCIQNYVVVVFYFIYIYVLYIDVMLLYLSLIEWAFIMDARHWGEELKILWAWHKGE